VARSRKKGPAGCRSKGRRILNAALALAARIVGCEVNDKAGHCTPTSAALTFRP
jgi:hypothetical protein